MHIGFEKLGQFKNLRERFEFSGLEAISDFYLHRWDFWLPAKQSVKLD